MNEEKLLELLIIISSCMQAFVVVMAMVALGHVQNKRAWKWFILAGVLVFARRLTGTIECLYDLDTNVIENLTTIVISIMWLLFIFVRTDYLRSKDGSQGRQ